MARQDQGYCVVRKVTCIRCTPMSTLMAVGLSPWQHHLFFIDAVTRGIVPIGANCSLSHKSFSHFTSPGLNPTAMSVLMGVHLMHVTLRTTQYSLSWRATRVSRAAQIILRP